jgi:hypothetical protein
VKRFIYRNLYMNSLGWKWTKAIRKNDFCQQCGRRAKVAKPLHLHHRDYRGYHLLGVLAFLLPDMISEMETLCPRHHAKAHKK